jgi:FAD/FMN-containing dehydrogenase
MTVEQKRHQTSGSEEDCRNGIPAYWGANLARLKQVKSAFDPDNVFHHAQSVPLSA